MQQKNTESETCSLSCLDRADSIAHFNPMIESDVSCEARHGDGTKERLLLAACQVFAAKGFSAATVAQICVEAEANIAAVHYHFGDKERLYEAAWQQAFTEALQVLTHLDAQAKVEASPEDRLRHEISLRLKLLFVDGPPGWFSRIWLHELRNPGPQLTAMQQIAQPFLVRMRQAIAPLMDCHADDPQTIPAAMSVMGQIVFVALNPELLESLVGTTIDSEQTLEHLVRFSLGGLRALSHSHLGENL